MEKTTSILALEYHNVVKTDTVQKRYYASTMPKLIHSCIWLSHIAAAIGYFMFCTEKDLS